MKRRGGGNWLAIVMIARASLAGPSKIRVSSTQTGKL
jgi:hypothetical protein